MNDLTPHRREEEKECGTLSDFEKGKAGSINRKNYYYFDFFETILIINSSVIIVIKN
jgi:hypothetical protein